MTKLKELLDENDSLPLTDFEREFLIPSILDRLSYYRDGFEKLCSVCDDPQSALFIDAAVRIVVRDSVVDKTASPPQVGAKYLGQLKANIQGYWITELTKVLNDYPDAASVDDSKKLWRLSQRAQNLCSSVVWCKVRLLSFTFHCCPVMMNVATGEQVYREPKEIQVIGFPFQSVLSEMESSATSLLETFKEWRRGKKEARSDHVSYLIALKQLQGANALNRFQILVILFTVVLTLGSNHLIAFVRELLHTLTTFLK